MDCTGVPVFRRRHLYRYCTRRVKIKSLSSFTIIEAVEALPSDLQEMAIIIIIINA